MKKERQLLREGLFGKVEAPSTQGELAFPKQNIQGLPSTELQERGLGSKTVIAARAKSVTPSLPTNIVDFSGFDSSIILILRSGIPRPTGDSPESLSQAMLGIILVGK